MICGIMKASSVGRKGQALLEYVLALAGVLVAVGILWGLVDVTARYSVRTERLVSADCP